jgi:hypothetical protein
MKRVFPSDMVVVENETAAGLRGTLAYLEEQGWCQITAGNAFGGVCVGYAIQIVAGGLCSPSAELLRQVIGWRSIEAWNDSKVTSRDRVRDAILKAIEIASGMPA